MSYAIAPTPGPKVRPATVGVASKLLYLSAVLLLITAAVSFVGVGPAGKVIQDYFANDPQQQQAARTGFIAVIAVFAVIEILIAVGLVLLGVFVGKGKQPARIITWIVSGLAVLCLGCGLVGTAAKSSLSGIGGTADSQALQEAINKAIPSWTTAAGTTGQVLTLVALIVVIILLALPASNDFFRKEQEVWVPPTSFPGGPDLPPPPPPGPTQYPSQ